MPQETAEQNEAQNAEQQSQDDSQDTRDAYNIGNALAARARGKVAQKTEKKLLSRLATSEIFKLVLVPSVLIVAGVLFMMGLGAFHACDQFPRICGKKEANPANSSSSIERSLQYQLAGYGTGEFNPQGFLDLVDKVETALKQKLSNAKANPKSVKDINQVETLANKGLKIIADIRTLAKAIIESKKPTTVTIFKPTKALAVNPVPPPEGKPTVPLASQVKIQAKIKELIEVIDGLEDLEFYVLLGEATYPLDPALITGYGNSLHGDSFARPETRRRHGTYLGPRNCGGSPRQCPGDAVDLSVPKGTEIRAVFDGTAHVSSRGGRDERIILRNDQQRATALYAHIGASIANNQKVKMGDVMGVTGAHGIQHLHFELWINDKSIHHDAGTPKNSSGKPLWDKMVNALGLLGGQQ